MKKALTMILIGLMVIAFSGMAMAVSDTQTFNFSCDVQRYIEVNPLYKVMNVTTPSIVPPSSTYNPKANYSFWKHVGSQHIVYANCPFTISLAGDNGEGDNLPIFDRQEVGLHATGWDKLDTKLTFSYIINSGPWQRIKFGDNGYYGGGVKNAWTNNPISFTETPHDGEVGFELVSQATFLHTVPDWPTNNTWDESPDAGTYTCTVVATYTAL